MNIFAIEVSKMGRESEEGSDYGFKTHTTNVNLPIIECCD